MDIDGKSDYVTRAGRQTRQKYSNYTFLSSKTKKLHPKMVLHHDDIRLPQRDKNGGVEATQSTTLNQNLLTVGASIVPTDTGVHNNIIDVSHDNNEEATHRLKIALNEREKEVAELQRLLQIQRSQQVNTTITQPTEVQTPINNNIEFLRDLGAIINNTNSYQIDMTIPKFSDENDTNPKAFLNDLEKFFRVKNISNERKLSITEHALSGKAKFWFELNHNYTNYEHFKNLFLAEFFSVPIQVKIKNMWKDRKYKMQDGTLQKYYYSQMHEAKNFEPKLSDFEINYDIIQQFPNWVQKSLASVDFGNSNAIAQTLANLDRVQNESNKFNNHQSSGNNRNNTQFNRHIHVDRSNRYNRNTRKQFWQQRHEYTRPHQYNYQFDRNYATPHYNNTYNSNRNLRLPDTSIPPPNFLNDPRQIHQYNRNENIQGQHNINERNVQSVNTNHAPLNERQAR